LFRLFAEGLIDGFRVDHVDGLADPSAYCRRLRARLEALAANRGDGQARRPYLIVEKILGPGERLPGDWGCDGTSGYDFMNEVSGVLHDPAGETPLGRLWAGVSGRSARFAEEEDKGRREMLERGFAAQLDAATQSLHRLASADLSARDVAAPAIRRSLVEILAHMRAYRTYHDPQGLRRVSQDVLDGAVEKAKLTSLRQDQGVVEHIAGWLSGRESAAGASQLQGEAIRRFQQLSAPLAAKAVEDTAFYRYGRLLSRLDVGFEAERFSLSVSDFHDACGRRLRDFPDALLATATHDHKRGEDTRARLAVLSELAEEWSAKVRQWIEGAAALRQAIDGALAPSRGDIAILLQTIVGAWPLLLDEGDREGIAEFAARIVRWQTKALREAKLATDWAAPNEAYEAAARAFVERLFADECAPLRADIAAFARRIAPAGAINGLTQMLLKLTTPGAPDIYQGAEFWDFSLVDPDNRRPVDFAARRAALASREPIDELARNWRNGRVKQAVARQALALRHERPGLFARGDYEKLTVEGPHAENVIAFGRQRGPDVAVVVACRLPARLVGMSQEIAVPSQAWSRTSVLLPPSLVGVPARDALSGEAFQFDEADVAVGRILGRLPLALLTDA